MWGMRVCRQVGVHAHAINIIMRRPARAGKKRTRYAYEVLSSIQREDKCTPKMKTMRVVVRTYKNGARTHGKDARQCAQRTPHGDARGAMMAAKTIRARACDDAGTAYRTRQNYRYAAASRRKMPDENGVTREKEQRAPYAHATRTRAKIRRTRRKCRMRDARRYYAQPRIKIKYNTLRQCVRF